MSYEEAVAVEESRRDRRYAGQIESADQPMATSKFESRMEGLHRAVQQAGEMTSRLEKRLRLVLVDDMPTEMATLRDADKRPPQSAALNRLDSLQADIDDLVVRIRHLSERVDV